MSKVGLLIHVYHLETNGWGKLVWGEPDRGLLGSLPKVVQLLLTESACEPITDIIIYSGPSHKDSLAEGEYAKQYLLNHFSELSAFPQLHPLLEQLSVDQHKRLKDRLNTIVVGEEIKNTADEIAHASGFFRDKGVTKVLQLATASHAPRCTQLQAIARVNKQIPSEQSWFVIAADTSFGDTTPGDVVILEPSHRGDDPMLSTHPTIAKAMKPYFSLGIEAKKACIQTIATFMAANTTKNTQH